MHSNALRNPLLNNEDSKIWVNVCCGMFAARSSSVASTKKSTAG